MGLFNRKKADGRDAAAPRAQTDYVQRSLADEAPTERMLTDERERYERARRERLEREQREAAEAKAAEEAEKAAGAAKVQQGSIAVELEQTEARIAGNGSSDDEFDTGTLQKDDLRRAMKGTKAEAQEEPGRVTAAEAMAPDPRQAQRAPQAEQPVAEPTVAAARPHPFAPVDEPVSDPGRRMKVYALANQKGGVAKTTTTLNLAVALSESGHRVLCVDLDPQGNLTMSQGIDPEEVELSMYDVLVDKMPIAEIVQSAEIDIAVASIDLAGAEIAMSTQIGRERSLQKALATVENDYDFVCIDTPPSLGLLTINALTAADKVIVPVQCEYLSMRGLLQLQNTLEMIRENLNPNVEIEGILPTMLDSRTVHAKEAVEILEENFGDLVFKSRIKKAIKFAEAPVKGSSVLKYDPNGNAAKYYRDLAEEVLTHGQTT